MLVPPMSKVMASGNPHAAATAAAGPHPAGRSGQEQRGRQLGRRRHGHSPPAEVITSTSSASVGRPRR